MEKERESVIEKFLQAKWEKSKMRKMISYSEHGNENLEGNEEEKERGTWI